MCLHPITLIPRGSAASEHNPSKCCGCTDKSTFLRAESLLPWSASTGLGRQRAGGSDAPVPEAFPKKEACVGVWDRVGSHTSGPWLLAPVLCLCPTLVTGQPRFPARLLSRSPFPKGTLTALTLKSNFGQTWSSSIVHKPDIYVSEILPLQDALLFMILSNKMPLRPQPSSFSFPDVFVGQSL